ncbi:MAG TPA: hypothetical protein VJ225_02425 [Nitrososphaeraceae archaeon]|nr:hypothetical protein [Nitrososphaeraceae archaeon]
MNLAIMDLTTNGVVVNDCLNYVDNRTEKLMTSVTNANSSLEDEDYQTTATVDTETEETTTNCSS